MKILDKWNNGSFPLWQLAQKPSKYLGLNVNVSGFVDAVFDNYFHLKDVENNNTLMVFCNEKMSLYRGKKVRSKKEAIRFSYEFMFTPHHLRG